MRCGRLDDRGGRGERDDIKPSGSGAEIVATAVLTGVEGRKLTFNVGARDAEGMIGEASTFVMRSIGVGFMEKVGSSAKRTAWPDDFRRFYSQPADRSGSIGNE